MKTVGIEQATLDACVQESQQERVVLTRGGRPIAIIVGLEGMDDEQMTLGNSDEFWKLVAQRRRQKTISRAELEQSFPGEPAAESSE